MAASRARNQAHAIRKAWKAQKNLRKPNKAISQLIKDVQIDTSQCLQQSMTCTALSAAPLCIRGKPMLT